MAGQGGLLTDKTTLTEPGKQYPHSFFGISDKFIPTTAKEMYRWAQYIFMINPIFAQIINKLSGYVTTDLVYDTDSGKATEKWKNMLDQQLHYKRFEKRMLLDLFTYGNAFARFIWPHEKYLTCRKCKNEQLLRNSDWKFNRFTFYGKCKRCDYNGPMDVKEKQVKNRRRIKLIRIDPRLIQPIYEPVTKTYVYTYTVPKQVAAVLRSSTARPHHIKLFVEELPLAVIDAVKNNALVKFDKDSIYHMKSDSISQDDESLGSIPFLPIFKIIWLYHTIWRAQEAVSLERIIPWTALSPRASATQDPIGQINLGEWRENLQEFVKRWRRDPNFVGMMPYPMDVINLRGEGKALDNWNGLTHLRDVMAGGMGVPPSFLFGGSVYSGANVELRVLENDMRNYVLMLEDMLRNFVVPKLTTFASLPKIDIRHENFKMADDIQQKSLITSLRQEGVISEETLVTELGFDYEDEQNKTREEMREKASQQLQQLREQQELQMEFLKKQNDEQLRMMQVQMQMQMQAQQEQMQAQQQAQAEQMMMQQQMGMDPAMQEEPDAVPPGTMGGQAPMDVAPVQAPTPGGADVMAQQAQQLSMTPELIDQQARAFLQTTTPKQRDILLSNMEKTNPEMARKIRQRMQQIKKEIESLKKPNPDQKPSTSKTPSL